MQCNCNAIVIQATNSEVIMLVISLGKALARSCVMVVNLFWSSLILLVGNQLEQAGCQDLCMTFTNSVQNILLLPFQMLIQKLFKFHKKFMIYANN